MTLPLLGLLVPAAASAQLAIGPQESVHAGTRAGGPLNLDDWGSGLVVQLPSRPPLAVSPTAEGDGFALAIPSHDGTSASVYFPAEMSTDVAVCTPACPGTSAVVSLAAGYEAVVSVLGPTAEVSFPNGAALDLGGSEVEVQFPGGGVPISLSNDDTERLAIEFPAQPGVPGVRASVRGSIAIDFPTGTRIALDTTWGPLDLAGPDLTVTLPSAEATVVVRSALGGLTVSFPSGSAAVVAGQLRGYVVGAAVVTPAVVPAGAQEWASTALPLGACGGRVVQGDFDGDGLADLACGLDAAGATDKVWVHRSTGAAFAASPWFQSAPGQFDMSACGDRFEVGDFNGDGKDDLACGYDYGASTGEVLVFLSTGTRFELQGWYSSGAGQFRMPACESRFVVGDFDGDGKDDLACGYDYGASTSEVFVLVSAGTRFTLQSWHRSGTGQFRMGACESRFVVGDFNGDGKDDLACGYDYGASTSEVFVFVSAGSRFDLQGWHQSGAGQFRMPACGDRFVVGDLDADGKDDLACGYDYGASLGGELLVFLSTGSRFGLQGWARTSFGLAQCGGRFRAADVNGDGLADITCGYDYGDGRSSGIFQWLSTGISAAFVHRFGSSSFDMATCGNRLLASKVSSRGRRTDLVCAADVGSSTARMYVWRAPRIPRTSSGQFIVPTTN